MPNQRKKGAQLFGAYVTGDQYKKLKASAKKRKLTLADLLREFVRAYLGEA